MISLKSQYNWPWNNRTRSWNFLSSPLDKPLAILRGRSTCPKGLSTYWHGCRILALSGKYQSLLCISASLYGDRCYVNFLAVCTPLCCGICVFLLFHDFVLSSGNAGEAKRRLRSTTEASVVMPGIMACLAYLAKCLAMQSLMS